MRHTMPWYCGVMIAALAWGCVELVALQRQRYHRWRTHRQRGWPLRQHR